MIWEKKIFLEGMNGDDSPRLISDKAALNIMNARVAVSKYGRNLRVQNIPGTTIVAQQAFPPYGSSQTIGSAPDLDNNRLIFCNYNTFGDHGIYCYDPSQNKIFAVLYDSQVTGGLNFSRNSLIHSCRVQNGCFYWCDSTNNEPKRININAGIETNLTGTYPTVSAYQWPMSQSVLYWIRRQPGLPLTSVKSTDAGFLNNFIKNEAFEFSWRYIYRDYETSTLSGLSALQNYNVSTDTFNFITISASLLETIQQDVIQVDFVAKYLNGGKSFVIKSWNTLITNDRNAIYQHNHNSIPLSFNFYNDFTGIALDDAYSVKPYDSLPIYAQTIEMARNRAFVGNYTIGYNTPTTTSLAAITQVQTGAGSLTGLWIVVRYNSGASTANYFYISSLDTFYSPGPYTPPVATVNFALITLVATGWGNFTAYANSIYTGIVSINYEGSSSTVSGGPPVPGLTGTKAFKSGASYQLSISFLDHAGRKSGILTSTALKLSVAEKIYAQVDYTTAINWTLSNTLATTEIPSWAYYYSVNITKCLTTRFFLDSRVKNITYATKDANGLYLFNTDTYAKNLNGVGVDITLLNSYGMGYVFAEGDLMKIYIGSNVYELSIISEQGNWIICELSNLGTLGNSGVLKTDVLFEIYTPYKPSLSEPYYEVAQIFSINNPTTNTRSYSIVVGTINGDITLLTRNDGTSNYLTENMSPNDKFPYQWNTDSGRPNFIDTIGQQVKTNTISFSNTFIQGTKTNGLSTFDALDVQDISLECGDITKLQVANKIGDEQGTIMLSICEHQTASMYLGESQLVGSSANAFVAQSTGVIGTINILQGSFGSDRPESVFEFLGLVFFIDTINGLFLQYSPEGLEEVSKYKQTRFFKRYCADYRAASTGNLDNINGFHHIRSCVNPFTKEVLVTLPGLIYQNYANVLPSYSTVPSYATSIINRFDIYDQLSKTMSFSYEQNIWGDNYEWLSEWSDYLDTQMYLFKNGNLYIADSDTAHYNRVFGVDYPVRICVAWNNNPSAIKDIASIGIEGNAAPDFTVLYSDNPNIQITDLTSTDFTNQEGVYYAPFFRDRLSPNATGTADEKLYTGDEIKSPYPLLMIEFQQYSQLFYLEMINLQYNLSRDQSQLITKL